MINPAFAERCEGNKAGIKPTNPSHYEIMFTRSSHRAGHDAWFCQDPANSVSMKSSRKWRTYRLLVTSPNASDLLGFSEYPDER